MKLFYKWSLFLVILSFFTFTFNTANAGSCTSGDYQAINAGTSATIGWNVSGGACSTAVSGGSSGSISGWSGNQNNTGSASVSASGNAGGTFNLSCDNGADSAICHVVVCPTGQHASGGSCINDVSGSCSGSAYNCNSGSSGSNSFDGSNTYTWMCNGSGPTGGNASCHECINGSSWNGSSCTIVPVNGQCSGTHYSCIQGNAINAGGDLHNWTWDCQGTNGGSTQSGCSEAKCPVAPAATIAWSPTTVSSGQQPVISWTSSNVTYCSFNQNGDTGLPTYDTTNGRPFNNNSPGWTVGPFVSSQTWSITCNNSCTDSVTRSAVLTYNDPPVANAGSDALLYLPLTSTSTGPSRGVSATDPNGTVSTTVWSYISFTNGSGSPSPSISGGATLSPTFNGLTLAGTYTFRLTVTDNQGASATDDMVVNVIPAAPTISGGCALPGTTATTSWTASAGATKYEIRIDNQTANGWSGSCASPNAGDVCNDNVAPTSYNLNPSIPDDNYSAWVHACNTVGCSAASNAVAFSCAKPITVTITQNPSAYLGDSAVIKWTHDGTDCNIYDNTGTILIKAIGPIASPSQSTLLQSDLPQTVNQFGYTVKCTDTSKPIRGIGQALATVTLTCPRDPVSYNQVTVSSCNNPIPSVSMSPGNQTIVIGQSIDYTGVATDTTKDLTALQFEWQKPDATWSWVNPPQGSVTYIGTSSFAGTSTTNVVARFTPTLAGVYRVRFVGIDDTLNNPALSYIGGGNPKYYTVGGRLTYSTLYRLDVTSRVGAQIIPDTGNNLRWQCFNANYMSLVSKTGAAATTTVVSYRSIPPSFGTFTPLQNTAYTLLCETTIDSDTFTYFLPTLTKNSVTPNSADIAWDCKSPSAQSATLQRVPGMAPTSTTTTAAASYIQGGLTPDTDYTYLLRCYDGPVVAGSVTGNQIGYADLDIHTLPIIVDPNPVVINAYIRAKGVDPMNSLIATTTDNTFFDWHYTIASGTAQSCTMSQQNDGHGWFSNVPPDSNTIGYTFLWSSMLNSDKQSFVNSFTIQHDWKLTCVNPVGTPTTKTWSLIRAQASNPVIDTITPGTNPTIADVVFSCVPPGATYTIRNSANAIVQSGPYSGPVTFSPTVADNYSITCANGPIVVVLIAPTMFDPIFRMTGSSRTIGNTTAATLIWDITNPDPTCRIWAEVTIPAVCDLTCQTNRSAASTTINNLIQTGYTDVNDPYWPNGNGSRTITQALTEAAYNTPNARGKATISGIKYGTTFVGKCDNTPAVKVKIGVTTINEG